MKKSLLAALLMTVGISLQVFSAEIPYEDYPDFVTFMDIYNVEVWSSHDKLVLMNKPRKLQKLGKERKLGNLAGSVFYKTKVVGFSGVVTIQYTDYSDHEGWILNGFSNIKANLNANGRMFGTVIVSGDYNAKVSYDNLKIKKGNAGGGYYTVEYGDGRIGEVPWDAPKNKVVPISDADAQVNSKDLKDLEDK